MGSNVSHRKDYSGAGTNRERGVSIVEFAIIFPLLFLVLILIIDAGRLITTNAILTRGASDGLTRSRPGLPMEPFHLAPARYLGLVYFRE